MFLKEPILLRQTIVFENFEKLKKVKAKNASKIISKNYLKISTLLKKNIVKLENYLARLYESYCEFIADGEIDEGNCCMLPTFDWFI